MRTVVLLVISNVFMTFAWYAHLKNLRTRHWLIAVAVSWGIAFFEYLVQVPANRIGYEKFSLAQLKIIQEVITLTVFVPFAVFVYWAPASTGIISGWTAVWPEHFFYFQIINPRSCITCLKEQILKRF